MSKTNKPLDLSDIVTKTQLKLHSRLTVLIAETFSHACTVSKVNLLRHIADELADDPGLDAVGRLRSLADEFEAHAQQVKRKR